MIPIIIYCWLFGRLKLKSRNYKHLTDTSLIDNAMPHKLLIFIFFYLITPVAAADTKLQQQQVKKEIKQLNSSLNTDKKKANTLKSEVRSLEKELGVLTRKEYATEKKIKKIGDQLQKSTIKRKELDEALSVQKKGLAEQLQALYSAGEQSHLRLLLKQDNPSDIGRTVKYFEYLNRSRVDRIAKVKTTLKNIRTIEDESIKAKAELQLLSTQLSSQKILSKNILLKRELAYQQTQKNVSSKSKELKQLKRREANLQSKIDGLIAKSSSPPAPKAALKKTTPPSKQTKKTTQLGRKVQSTQHYRPNQKFSSLRGKLSWPVKGRIIHNYGERRNEKQRWKGTVISAKGGAKVRAIAQGKVEFAGWFNGYGYLVIIRHDKSYRSLYGYNRAVYVKVGQIIQGGKVIAAIGNSGAQKQNALYFEIRKQARTKNPTKWCR